MAHRDESMGLKTYVFPLKPSQGGGIEKPANIVPLTVTENGTYTKPDGVDGFNPVTVDVVEERYEGSYKVVPSAEEQLLDTKDKYMTDDVRITSIPYFDVGNPAGGSTVYIGTEILTK